MAQESLKDIFSKARHDPGSTPQKTQARRNSVDTSEVKFSVEAEQMDCKGKRRSLSDDETEHLDSKPSGFWYFSKREDDNRFPLSGSLNRRATRFKPSPQPVTMEFLRERFDSQISRHMPDEDSSSIREHHILLLSSKPPILTLQIEGNSSNDTATLWRDLNSSHASPPAATSTPQQSVRMSVNSEFQSSL
jgi:hypothetical protein